MLFIKKKNFRTTNKVLILALIISALASPINSLAVDNEVEPLPASSETERILRETQYISENIMSPYCPGRTLSSCPSPDARALRSEIKQWFERGYSRTAVMRQLKSMFGSSIQGSPEGSGFGLFAWIAPFLIIMGLFFVLIIYLQRSRHRRNIYGENYDSDFVTRQNKNHQTNCQPEYNKFEKEFDLELKKRLGD
ncbi:MAG TPA: cytochrome c-type biogenesis protein CcmH [Oligoflexia bacterium]|nr:cytochrome c-type biogenesis protein CcmH [Oligoflexia bacterium]HMP47811.1 cytochrome c-type biogenesis protein CcmH [Oligoflexia bacterium]